MLFPYIISDLIILFFVFILKIRQVFIKIVWHLIIKEEKMINTTIYIVRHGQSLGNATRTFLGHTDLDLSELGYLQAQATAKELKTVKFDKIYSSDLIRAYNTAVPQAIVHNLKIIKDKNLREAYAGEWEGMAVDDIIAKWGVDFFRNEWAGNFGNFIFPSGESVKGAGERFYNEIVDIAEANIGKTILICAHAAVVRSFWAIISGLSFDEIPEPSNGIR